MTRFLCVGDLHLGAGADLGREPGERLAEQADVWVRIVKLANELEATILFAGDAWERRRPTPVELLAFRDALHWLKHPLIGIPGNHDVEAFRRPTGYDVFLIPDGRARVIPEPRVVRYGGAAIACLPWAPASNLVALEGGGDRDDLNRRLADGLVDIARGLFVTANAIRQDDEPVILLAHWSVGGATTPTGAPADLFREPVIDAAALDAIGFDAVVLGHIHKPQLLSMGPVAVDGTGSTVAAGRPMFYVGSPMPLNFGEAQSAHVVWLLDLEASRPAQLFQLPIESRPLIVASLTGAQALEATDAEWPPSLPVDGALVKIKVAATADEARRLNPGLLRREAEAAGAHKVWSVTVEVARPEVVRGAAVDESIDDVEAMRRWLELNPCPRADVVLARHRDYLAKAAA